MSAIQRAKQHSEDKLKALRAGIQNIVPAGEIVLTCGSYARRESSSESDIDFFTVTQVAPTNKDETERDRELTLPWLPQVRATINQIVPIDPAQDGAFASLEFSERMLRNIGGEGDSNSKISRRMLFLLEGDWLFNPEGAKQLRRQILERYIGEGMTDHQLALFLLNDIIRFYRTMAVDYEFKTGEGDNPKPWGIRNIKLVFSRKLLYASGLFSVAMTADRAREEKIKLLENLFDLPVIDRMIRICGESEVSSVLKSYDHFLGRLEEREVRERLKQLTKDQRDDLLFRDLKNEGHHFTRELLKLFERTFDATHPIHRAVVF